MVQYPLLHQYSQNDHLSIQSTISHCIETLPFTLSFPIKQAFRDIEKDQYSKAMNHILDFFEISIQYTSIIFFKLLQEQQNSIISQNTITEIIKKIDTKRPLSFGDWLNDIFTPLLETAFKELPNNALITSIHHHIYSKRRNSLLGSKNEASIVQIRNEYKGHSTTLSEDIYQGVVFTLEPRFLNMIKAIEPLTQCEAIGVDENHTLWKMNGENMSSYIIEKELPYIPGHYYLQIKSPNDSFSYIDLYPLIFFNKEKYVYIFQTLRNESISYISSNENAITCTTDKYNDDFDRNFQQTVPSFDIAKELNWNEFKQYIFNESSSYLDKIYKEKKYNEELFVERKYLTDVFNEFRNSQATLFPLIGDAGQGKTNQLCFWTEQFIEADIPVLIFNSSELGDIILEERLKQIFNIHGKKSITSILNSLHHKAEQEQSYVYFFFDAINECLKYKSELQEYTSPYLLYQAINRLLIANNYTRFKVLLTCRTYTWKNCIVPHLPNQSPFVFQANKEDKETVVRGFSEQETRQAYQTYQNLYQMKSSFDELDPRITIRLKDPLILKFTCSNFLGKELTNAPKDYTSIALFKNMIEDISNSYAGNKQRQIIDEIGDYLLQCYLNGTPTDNIPVSNIKQAYNDHTHPLHKLANLIFKKEGITVAYTELQNKAERPILKEITKTTTEGSSLQLQFIYERFLEYIIACAFLRKEKKSNNVTQAVPASSYINSIKKVGTNVVFLGAMRNALLIDHEYTNDFTPIIELETSLEEDYNILSLVTETVNTLIKENYENELFALMNRLLDEQPQEGHNIINEYNGTIKKIESNQADHETISLHNKLSQKLLPIIRLRKLASVSIINGIILTDFYKMNLYNNNAKELLWKIMTDNIYDIRNDACMYTYYLSNKTMTIDYLPLEKNLTEEIIQEMYTLIKSHNLLYNVSNKKTRKRSIIFLETATRLSTLLIIDNLLSPKGSKETVRNLLNEIQDIFKYFTGNFYLIRLFMPFFQLIMRKQITFQSIYVNNAIEYQTFWESDTFSSHESSHWNRHCIKEAMSFLKHYNLYSKTPDSEECKAEEKRFQDFYPFILSAYTKGDSFSYFALERILVIMGVSNWKNIEPLIEALLANPYRNNQWFDYSQMSILYILFQIQVHTPTDNQYLLEIFTRECEIWTCKNRGRFAARRSNIANPTKLYKRNLMNWYAVVYCVHYGDGIVHEGDHTCVPLFYKLIDKSIQENDKELLYHLIENISELITDFGYIKTALDLLNHIINKYDNQEKIDLLEKQIIAREGIYQFGLVKLIGNVLSTAKNYYPKEVEYFIQNDLNGLKFPGISTYKEDILNYHPSGETLSDLLTHRFGNFLMWALLNEEVVDNFAIEAMNASVDAKSCFSWYEKVVKILVKHMFNIKL